MATTDFPSDFIALDMDSNPAVAAADSAPDAFPIELDAPTADAPTADAPTSGADALADLRSDLTAIATQSAMDANAAPSGMLAQNRARSTTPMVRPSESRREAPIVAPSDDPEIAIRGAEVAQNVLHSHFRGVSFDYSRQMIRKHEIARAIVVDLLASAGMSDLAPGIRTSKAQFGKTMRDLNSVTARDSRGDDRRLTQRAMTRKDFDQRGEVWPTALEARYVVGHIDASATLGSLGEKDLVVSLWNRTDADGHDFCEVEFVGGTDAVRKAVMDRFQALTGSEILDGTTLAGWYVDRMIGTFGAYRDGFKLMVVDTGTEASSANVARALAFMNVLQGSNVYGPSAIMGRILGKTSFSSTDPVTWGDISTSIVRGMMQEIQALADRFADAWERAKTVAREAAIEANEDPNLAADRALIGSNRANSAHYALMTELDRLTQRARESRSVVGTDRANVAVDACRALHAEWSPRCVEIVPLDMD